MKQFNLWIALSLLLITTAASCNSATAPEPEITLPAGLPTEQNDATAQPTPLASATAVSQPTNGNSPSIRLTPDAPPPVELVPTLNSSAVTGEVPAEIMTAIFADLTASQNVDQAAISVIQAEATVWNDGALGCPQPGEVYTQAIVNGYLIVLAVDGRTYNYHAAENGYFVLCQNNLAPSPPIVGTPTS